MKAGCLAVPASREMSGAWGCASAGISGNLTRFDGELVSPESFTANQVLAFGEGYLGEGDTNY